MSFFVLKNFLSYNFQTSGDFISPLIEGFQKFLVWMEFLLNININTNLRGVEGDAFLFNNISFNKNHTVATN